MEFPPLEMWLLFAVALRIIVWMGKIQEEKKK